MQEEILKILMAVLLGGAIGLERQFREKAAGFRTIIIICVGTAIFSIYSTKFGWGDPSRMAAGIVTGIGFIGAGVILHSKGQISGLTTAATIWYSAALGVGIGLGQYFISVASVIVVLAVLIMFPYIERIINKYHETMNYSIVLKKDELGIEEIKKIVTDKNLKIINTNRAKRKDFIILNLKVRGKAQNHILLRDIFINEQRIYEFNSKL